MVARSATDKVDQLERSTCLTLTCFSKNLETLTRSYPRVRHWSPTPGTRPSRPAGTGTPSGPCIRRGSPPRRATPAAAACRRARPGSCRCQVAQRPSPWGGYVALPSLVAATRLSVQVVSATTGDSISGAECAFFSRGSIMEGRVQFFQKKLAITEYRNQQKVETACPHCTDHHPMHTPAQSVHHAHGSK